MIIGPHPPIELPPIAFILGAGAMFGAMIATWTIESLVRRHRLRDLEAAPGPEPEAALHYGTGRYLRYRGRHWPPPHVAIFLLVLIAWNGRIDLLDKWAFLPLTLLALPSLWWEIGRIRRFVTVTPAIAVFPHGLFLAGWRGPALLPWREVGSVATDPFDADGYLGTEEEVILWVEAKNGRKWRFTSRHFPDEARGAFAALAALAERHRAALASL